MDRSGKAFLASLLLVAPVLVAQTPRRPRGVYAIVAVDNEIATLQAANPSVTAAQLEAGFKAAHLKAACTYSGGQVVMASLTNAKPVDAAVLAGSRSSSVGL